MLEKLVRKLVADRSDMERDVFNSPPSDWPGFQRRLGAYIELERLIAELEEAMKGKENDQ